MCTEIKFGLRSTSFRIIMRLAWIAKDIRVLARSGTEKMCDFKIVHTCTFCDPNVSVNFSSYV